MFDPFRYIALLEVDKRLAIMQIWLVNLDSLREGLEINHEGVSEFN